MEIEVLPMDKICRTCLSTSSDSLEMLYNDAEDLNYEKMMIETFCFKITVSKKLSKSLT